MLPFFEIELIDTMTAGFVFVSTGYRLLPNVDMVTIFRDVAKSVRWVHDHIAEHGSLDGRHLIQTIGEHGRRHEGAPKKLVDALRRA